MRADLFSRTFLPGRLAGLAVIALAAAGCKTEKDPDDPTLIGAPPATAYIGAEYYYNWGSYGGEGILDYSLTNAPAWLALEDTSNKARQGVIMRGVPGLSGGNRGLDDLGKFENIDIVTTDGRMAGFQPFTIEVKPNLVTVEVPELTEGASPEIKTPSGEHCAIPDLEPQGEHNGLPTHRVFASVKLEKPSVTRVTIAFELESDFSCSDPVDAISHQCHAEDSNLGKAIIGVDIVAQGSDSAETLDEDANPLSYISYQARPDGIIDRGLVTFEPGVTECFIPLEVIDDRVAERTELARLKLSEVRTGLASLGTKNTGVTANISIADNEPVVALRTLNGGITDTLNVEPGVTDLTGVVFNPDRVYTAILTGERDGEVRVRLAPRTRGSTAGVSDFVLIQDPDELPEPDPLDPEPEPNELVFLPGQDEVVFSVAARDYANDADNLHDRRLVLVVDEAAQAGLEGYARGESDELLTLAFNRQTQPLAWSDGFVATDIQLGIRGELYVAGHAPVSGGVQLQVRRYDQTGTLIGTALEITDGSTPLPETRLFLALGQRTERVNGSSATHNELALAWSEDGDVVVELYRYDRPSETYLPLSADNRLVTGSSGTDSVTWLGYQEGSGQLVVAGESSGSWPGQASAGGTDGFLAVVETTALELKLKSVRQLGSAGDDVIAGGHVDGGAPLLFGYAPQVMDGNGGIGPFFVSGTEGSQIQALGAEATEVLRDGLFAHNRVWLIGDGPWGYEIMEDDDGVRELVRSPGNQAGFVLGVTTSGTPELAFTLPSVDDQAVQSMHKGVAIEAGVIVTGKLENGDGMLARLTTVEDPEPYQSWQKALAEPGIRFLDLANYRDSEIVALADTDAGRQILLFSPEGRRLTP